MGKKMKAGLSVLTFTPTQTHSSGLCGRIAQEFTAQIAQRSLITSHSAAFSLNTKQPMTLNDIYTNFKRRSCDSILLPILQHTTCIIKQSTYDGKLLPLL